MVMQHDEIVLTSEALSDIETILNEYAALSEAIAKRFFEQVQAAIRSLERQPHRFQEVFLFVRRAFIAKFPYHVYFAVDEVAHRVEILAVFHQKRDERLIRKRINFE
jgi:plasmid stabilization system protein ParE